MGVPSGGGGGAASAGDGGVLGHDDRPVGEVMGESQEGSLGMNGVLHEGLSGWRVWEVQVGPGSQDLMLVSPPMPN